MSATGCYTEGAGANGYIYGSDPVCNYALRGYNSCYLYTTQKVALSSGKLMRYFCNQLFYRWLGSI